MHPNPMTAWMSLWRAGWDVAQTGMKMGELAQASQEVVESRTASIKQALRNPLKGDYRELARMVPEKVSAFTKAAASATQDARALQADAVANYQQLTEMASGRHLVTPLDWLTLMARSTRMMECALLAGGKAMAPIHLTATNNAKRLKRKKRAA